MILTDNYGKHNGRKDIICCLMGWNIDNIRKEIDEMTNEELTGTSEEELKEAQDYFDEYYNPIPQKREEKKKVKNNVMLNELFNRLIEQANVIKELEKDNDMLRNERKLMVDTIVKAEKEKEELKKVLEELKENEKAFKVEKTEIKRFPYSLERAMDLWFKDWNVKQSFVMIELITRLVEKPYSVVQFDKHAQLLEWYKDSRAFEDGIPSFVTTLDGKTAGDDEDGETD